MKKSIIYIVLFVLYSRGFAQYESDLKFIVDAHSPKNQTINIEIKSKNVQNEISMLATGTIRFYQLYISSQDMPLCNFTPSCSQYGSMAIQRHGIVTGLLMISDRLQRCNAMAAEYYTLHPVTHKFNDPVDCNVLWEH